MDDSCSDTDEPVSKRFKFGASYDDLNELLKMDRSQMVQTREVSMGMPESVCVAVAQLSALSPEDLKLTIGSLCDRQLVSSCRRVAELPDNWRRVLYSLKYNDPSLSVLTIGETSFHSYDFLSDIFLTFLHNVIALVPSSLFLKRFWLKLPLIWSDFDPKTEVFQKFIALLRRLPPSCTGFCLTGGTWAGDILKFFPSHMTSLALKDFHVNSLATGHLVARLIMRCPDLEELHCENTLITCTPNNGVEYVVNAIASRLKFKTLSIQETTKRMYPVTVKDGLQQADAWKAIVALPNVDTICTNLGTNPVVAYSFLRPSAFKAGHFSQVKPNPDALVFPNGYVRTLGNGLCESLNWRELFIDSTLLAHYIHESLYLCRHSLRTLLITGIPIRADLLSSLITYFRSGDSVLRFLGLCARDDELVEEDSPQALWVDLLAVLNSQQTLQSVHLNLCLTTPTSPALMSALCQFLLHENLTSFTAFGLLNSFDNPVEALDMLTSAFRSFKNMRMCAMSVFGWPTDSLPILTQAFLQNIRSRPSSGEVSFTPFHLYFENMESAPPKLLSADRMLLFESLTELIPQVFPVQYFGQNLKSRCLHQILTILQGKSGKTFDFEQVPHNLRTEFQSCIRVNESKFHGYPSTIQPMGQCDCELPYITTRCLDEDMKVCTICMGVKHFRPVNMGFTGRLVYALGEYSFTGHYVMNGQGSSPPLIHSSHFLLETAALPAEDLGNAVGMLPPHSPPPPPPSLLDPSVFQAEEHEELNGFLMRGDIGGAQEERTLVDGQSGRPGEEKRGGGGNSGTPPRLLEE